MLFLDDRPLLADGLDGIEEPDPEARTDQGEYGILRGIEFLPIMSSPKALNFKAF